MFLITGTEQWWSWKIGVQGGDGVECDGAGTGTELDCTFLSVWGVDGVQLFSRGGGGYEVWPSRRPLVLIDDKLNWKGHIKQVLLKISRHAAVLSRICYKVSSHIIPTLYNTLLLPHISYCAIVWASGANIKIKQIFTIQERIMRLIVFAKNRSSSKPIFLKLRRLTIHDIYKMQVATFMYNSLHGVFNQLFVNFFNYSLTIKFIRIKLELLVICILMLLNPTLGGNLYQSVALVFVTTFHRMLNLLFIFQFSK